MVRIAKIKEKALVVYAGLGVFLFIALFVIVAAGNFGNNNSANLTINDTTDSGSQRYTFCNEYCANKQKSSYNSFSFNFYANFINSSGYTINSTNGNGNCQIRFNENGTFSPFANMLYNGTNSRYEYNGTFNYKGNLLYQINCTSNFGNVTLNDNYTVTNTNPYILSAASGQIDFDGDGVDPQPLLCIEDTLCSYNFNENVSEDDFNDVLTYNYISNSNTTLTNFSMNSSSGLLSINITRNSEAGQRSIELSVDDDTPGNVISAVLEVYIAPINDAPYFINLTNISTTSAQGTYNRIIYATDEENDKPYTFNVTIMNCSVAEWSTRNCSDSIGRQLFNSSQIVFNGQEGYINMSFPVSKNDVGNYTINFTVRDMNNTVLPYNASYTKIINFEVLNSNSPPVFNYTCNNERNTTEDQRFSCRVNITDEDETKNITLIVLQESFFKLNGSYSSLTQTVNKSTGYATSFLVNFTTTDVNVGNSTIILRALDTDSNATQNSFSFFVYNTPDNVSLKYTNITNPIYTTSIYEYYINATDDDLLITQTNYYDENLTFYSNESWFVYNTSNSQNNYTSAKFLVYPNIAGQGTHYVNISVIDIYPAKSDSFIMLVNITNNTSPEWNSTFYSNTTYILTEDSNFYMNLSANVTDKDGDVITFNYTVNNIVNTSFGSFEIGFNYTNGIINFTPNDYDVGYHNITINAIDSRGAISPLNFVFIVNNIADNPYISSLTCSNQNGLCDPTTITGNMTVIEDDDVDLLLHIEDNDFMINNTQRKSYYDENLTVNVTIEGNNSLFSFVYVGHVPNFPLNDTLFRADFILTKNNVGHYNVSINVSDKSNLSYSMRFNMTVIENQHSPVMQTIDDRNISIYESVFFDVNSTDTEEGNESLGEGNFTYTLSNNTLFGDFLIINSTTGSIYNYTSLVGKGGIWNFTVKVYDRTMRNDTKYFMLYIFDEPNLLESYDNFSMSENVSYDFNFTANHSVGTELTYSLYINGVLRESVVGEGNGNAFEWGFVTNFSDETTCSGMSNMTLNISNEKLSRVYDWNLTVSHTNYPLELYDDIGTGNPKTLTSRTLYLSEYYRDIDASDGCTNQTIGFIITNISSTSLTVLVNNWSGGNAPNITFSGEGRANYSVTAFEYNDSSFDNSSYNVSISNVTSNNFTVFVETTPAPTPTPRPNSGGGTTTRPSTEYKPISLRIIVPDPVSTGKKEKIVLPLTLKNDGSIALYNISLSTNVAINGSISNDIKTNLSIYNLSSLSTDQSVNMTLTAEIDVEVEGLYEINIYANVSNPAYSDWGKIYLTVKEGTSFEDKIIFTEELIVSNPECAEIQEIIDEARQDYVEGDMVEAQNKIDMAINSCKSAISQKPSPIIKSVLRSWGISNYILFAAVCASILGFMFYLYKRYMMSRAIRLDDD